ncbi:MAG TPA: hypothetical protein VMZ28_22025 [Kofleriaceae bacterium]|nr:hypothetical protein [Kofleriaceae bacterium]
MTRMAITMVLAVALVGLVTPREAGAGRGGGGKKLSQLRAKVARRVAGSPKLAAAKMRLKSMGATRAERVAHQRGRALADVHKTGRTRVRTVGDFLFHPALHGVVAFGGMLLLGMNPQMSLIAGGIVYFSGRSAKKTGDGWLKLENSSIDVLERDGPDVAKQRFSNQGAREPARNLAKLQRNRQLRNQHYDD